MIQETKGIIKRESNFELLRTISMIFIIIHHYSYHGGLLLRFGKNYLLARFLDCGGKIGVNIFVLIGAYFMSCSSFNYKKIIKIILQVHFYAIIMMFVTYAFTKTITVKMFIDSIIIPVINQYWFVRVYIFICILSPFFNTLIRKTNRSIYKTLLIINFVLLYIIFPFFIKYYVSQYVLFIFLYFLGAYIKIYDVKFKYKIDKIILMALICTIIVFASYNRIHSNMISDSSCYLLIISVIMFILFKDLKVKYNSVINELAKLSFPVYLIHDNEYFRIIFWRQVICSQKFYYSNTLFLIGNIIFCIVLLFACSYVIELFKKSYFESIILND